MPSEIRLEIARKAKKDVWNIDELLDTIKFEIEACEASETTKSNQSQRSPNTGFGSKREGVKDHNTPTANSLLVGSRDGEFEDQRSKLSARWVKVKPGLKSNVLFVIIYNIMNLSLYT